MKSTKNKKNVIIQMRYFKETHSNLISSSPRENGKDTRASSDVLDTPTTITFVAAQPSRMDAGI